jgi:DNA-binding NarL/FixJ family response regulator
MSSDEFEITGEASDGYEFFDKIKTMLPDIVLMDISLPKISGIELTKIIKKEYPDVKVLILSMYTNEDFIFNAIKAGANGYLPKNTSKKELFEALNEISKGHVYFSEQISNIILKTYVKKAQIGETVEKNSDQLLTGREMEVLKLAAEGLSNPEIAENLCISTRTVESHKNHLMQKLELKTSIDLVRFAIKNKIIEL